MATITENNDYIETWYATIALALSERRGGDASQLAYDIGCSPSTLRKYVRMMEGDGLACEINYGSGMHPDVRYYLISEATFMFTQPTRAAYLAIKEMALDARDKYRHGLGNDGDSQRLWDRYTGLYDAQTVLYRQLQVQVRLAVKCANS